MKKTMIRKLMALMVAAFMLVTLLAGCQTADEPSSSPSAAETEPASSPEAAAAPSPEQLETPPAEQPPAEDSPAVDSPAPSEAEGGEQSGPPAQTRDESQFEIYYPNVYNDAEQAYLDSVLSGGGGMGSPPGGGGEGSGDDAPMTGANQGGLAGNQDAQMSTDSLMSLDEVSKADMLAFAYAWDYWNPLYNDEEYAKNTRYGQLTCIPFFKEAGAMFPTLNDSSLGDIWSGTNDGGSMTFYKPIFAGDNFTMGDRETEIIDKTPEEGSTTRSFTVIGKGKLLNQDGEVVIEGAMYGSNTFSRYKEGVEVAASSGGGMGGDPGGAPPDGSGGGAPPDEGSDGAGGGESGGFQGDSSGAGGGGGGYSQRYTYTDEDWAEINRIWDEEYIRGADTLYWDDVVVGDQIAWVTTGPTTVFDMIRCFGNQVISMLPLRETLKNTSSLVGYTYDNYGVFHVMEEGHFSDQGVEGNVPIYYMAYARGVMIRAITNWMGDDGWLYKYSWWNGNYAADLIEKASEFAPELAGREVTGHGSVYDCVIAKGVIIDKVYDESEPEEYRNKAILVVWSELMDGTLCNAAEVEVILPAK